ncbi:MAG: site-2 protease family protein [Oscillospiraceae bacterium]|nr:site-2 protease family protein [Oscillospiraceae bacterium]
MDWLRQLRFDNLLSTALAVAASLLCIVVHETCHGLIAWWLGDGTAKNAGRLTLNPLRHIDIVGLAMMAILKFGWAKPVPIDMRNFKNPKAGMAVTAAAGPISNILLAFVFLLIRSAVMGLYLERSGGVGGWLVLNEFLEYVIVISAGLAVFNLIPISPLDGSKILFAFLPQEAYFKLMRYERYGMLVLIAALFFGWLDKPLYFLRGGLLEGLQTITMWPFELILRIRFA